MTPHSPRPAPNIPLRLLRRVLPHVPPELLHLALFGLLPRNSHALRHLAADGLGLARRAHGRVRVRFVGRGRATGFGAGRQEGGEGEGWRVGLVGGGRFGAWEKGGRTFGHYCFWGVNLV